MPVSLRPLRPGKELASRLAHAGAYLADECRLFRVIGSYTVFDETCVEIEDCATLDVWLVPLDEVGDFRPIRPEPNRARRR